MFDTAGHCTRLYRDPRVPRHIPTFARVSMAQPSGGLQRWSTMSSFTPRRYAPTPSRRRGAGRNLPGPSARHVLSTRSASLFGYYSQRRRTGLLSISLTSICRTMRLRGFNCVIYNRSYSFVYLLENMTIRKTNRSHWTWGFLFEQMGTAWLTSIPIWQHPSGNVGRIMCTKQREFCTLRKL